MDIVLVNDTSFELWGYGYGSFVRLQDMAYILNGTPAQFDIRVPDDDRLEFWIIRGVAYTATGGELHHIPIGYGARGSYGFFHWYGFDGYPEQTVILGVDGTDSPDAFIPVRVMRDVEYVYFCSSALAELLGFTWGWNWDDDAGHSYSTITLESHMPQLQTNSIELVDLMVRLSGHWIDATYFYNPAIDQNVVDSVRLGISVHGLNDNITTHVNSAALSWTRHVQWWYPVAFRYIENNLVEITVDVDGEIFFWPGWDSLIPEGMYDSIKRLYNHRIVVDTTERQFSEITLYLGDTPYTMIPYEMRTSVGSHLVETTENGDIIEIVEESELTSAKQENKTEFAEPCEIDEPATYYMHPQNHGLAPLAVFPMLLCAFVVLKKSRK